MSFVLGVLLTLGAVIFGIVLWQRLPVDPVGRPTRTRRRETGFHGQLTEWIYWDAPLKAPKLEKMGETDASRSIGDRALTAVVRRVAAERQISTEAAHALLVKNVRQPAAGAFLAGKMTRAIRLDWQRRFNGPGFLFYPWFYLVALVRHGRRHLYLETLSAILQELQKA